MTDNTQVVIKGVGFVTTVDVSDGESIADALKRAGLNPEDVDVNVGGEAVESPAESPVEAGSEVTATPKEARLG